MIEGQKLTTMSSSYAFTLAGKTVAGGAKRVCISTDRAERSAFAHSLVMTYFDGKI
jgi:hypothetical protein